MNKKGFTLVELIAVITIISLVSIFSFVNLTKLIKEGEEKKVETFEINLKNATKIYVETNMDKFPELQNVHGNILVPYSIIEDEYLSEQISNPTNCHKDDIFVKVTKELDDSLTYELILCE